MSKKYLPNEALTETIAAKEMYESLSIDNFIGQLTPEQQNRFREIAHHLVYVGFVNGQNRSDAKNLTTEQEARVGFSKIQILTMGAAYLDGLYQDGLLNE